MIGWLNQFLWLIAALWIQMGWTASGDAKSSLKIAFIIETLLVRGTEVATFEYADYNEKILGNESFILFLNVEQKQIDFKKDHSPEVKETFVNRFGDHFIDCKTIDDINYILGKENISIVYWLVSGNVDPRYTQMTKKTAIHAVFDFVPQGYAFAAISNWLSISNPKYTDIPVVPHIVHSPKDLSTTLHDKLQIPKDAVVFGRHGGYDTFDVSYAKEAVIELAQKHQNWYFLFLNTEKFCELSNVIFLEKTWDSDFKERFINTSDAMIHARTSGETFGLACAEFSIRNKPVITCRTHVAAHIDMLGDKGLIYSSKEELIHHLEYCAAHREEIRSMDWDAYSKQCNPEAVMKQFNEVFVLPLIE